MSDEQEDKKRRALPLIERQWLGVDAEYPPPPPEEMTCFNCKQEKDCPSAWDIYNTGGDCLESK